MTITKISLFQMQKRVEIPNRKSELDVDGRRGESQASTGFQVAQFIW